ncbi:hypothetical protein [Bacillus sp. ISL-39]|uniref:hypothetical protein n=1 Tax=Bacillus sp. ISL-39 TaxID=2819124 RepID=UPI001BE9EBB0|nr:hypothetical protein [Bacillus sp. ISL-39]MBT2638588.1 hypothetical protein [Bacillus sp. ISL-39]
MASAIGEMTVQQIRYYQESAKGSTGFSSLNLQRSISKWDGAQHTAWQKHDGWGSMGLDRSKSPWYRINLYWRKLNYLDHFAR